MKVQYQLTFKDYLEFNGVYQRQNISFFWIGLLWRFLGIILILLAILQLVISNIESAIFSLTLALVFLLGYQPLLRYQAEKVYKKQPHFGEITNLEILDDCLIFTKPNVKVEYQWAYYQYFIETNNLFILQEMESGVMGLIIPKNAFESQEQVYELRNLLKKHITRFE
jgi:hypothetical protein